MLSEGYLIRKTGICAGHYKYFESKEECDAWFLSKSFANFDNYSVIQPDLNSKNGYNVACIHLNMSYSEITECDYVSYKNEGYDRYFHCQVIEREYINELSCRIYIVIDYVATYYDTIKIGKSFIERTHVIDDFNNFGTASKYLLPEPISVNIDYHQEYNTFNDIFEDVNKHLLPKLSEFTLLSNIDNYGNINNPKIIFQSGASVAGFIYNGDKEYIESLLNKYVTYSHKLINKASSTFDNLVSVYYCPKVVSENRDSTPFFMLHQIRLLDIYIHAIDYLNIKNAKTLDYFRYEIVTNSDSIIFSQAETGPEINMIIYFTGGQNGKCTINILNDKKNFISKKVSTKSWANVNISGNPKTYKFNLG